MLACPHGHEGSCDVSNHMMDEGIGTHIDMDPIALPHDMNEMHDPSRAFRLTGLGPKGTEIMITNQMLRGLGHAAFIQMMGRPGDTPDIERRCRGSI